MSRVGARLAALAMTVPLLAASYWPTTNDADVEAGQKAYREGRFQAAAESFREAQRGDGDSDRLQYDLGTALYQVALHDEDGESQIRNLDLAIVALRSALDTRNTLLKRKAQYNLGNALVLRKRLDEAIAAYRAVLRADPNNDDARYNLELAQLAKRSELDLSKLGAIASADGRDQSSAQDRAGEGEGEGEASPEGSEESQEGEGESESAGEGQGQASNAGEGQADGRDSQSGPKEALKADTTAREPAKSIQTMDVLQKLEALERRSGELRRGNLLRKTRARLREPGKPGSGQ